MLGDDPFEIDGPTGDFENDSRGSIIDLGGRDVGRLDLDLSTPDRNFAKNLDECNDWHDRLDI